MTPGRRDGRFITFEGGEGVGKSTQVSRLSARLRGRSLNVVTTREPGGSPKAEDIRALLLSGAIAPFGPAAEAILFGAARLDHVRRVIGPALSRGDWVISDRFYDSTRAYQGAAASVEPRLIDALETVAVGMVRPDLTLVLDLPGHAGLRRAHERRGSAAADRFEKLDEDFHDRLRAAFLAIAAADPNRCVVIDASGDPDLVELKVWAAVNARLFDGQVDGF